MRIGCHRVVVVDVVVVVLVVSAPIDWIDRNIVRDSRIIAAAFRRVTGGLSIILELP